MSNEKANQLKDNIKEITKKVDIRYTVHLQLDKSIRIIEKAECFHKDCNDCEDLLEKFNVEINEIMDNIDVLRKYNSKNLRKVIRDATQHLIKTHQLVQRDYYFEVFLSMGVLFGFAFSTWWLTLMLIALGMILDEDAVKKGKVF